MTSDYKIASVYARLVLQADNTYIQKLEPSLINDLSEAIEHDFIEGELVNRMFEAIAHQGLVSWVSEYGRQVGIGSHGPMGFAALSAPNLQSALDVFTEYLETRSTATTARLIEQDGFLHYILEDQTGHELAGRWLIESNLLIAQNLIETIMAHPLGPQAQIHFSYPQSTQYQSSESVFNAHCLFGQKDNRLSIPASWAMVTSPLHDDESFRTNLAKAREIKLKLNTNPNDVLRLVTTRLLNHFDRRMSNNARHSSIPSLDLLANELGMSPRTLIRKLSLQNASYKTVLEDIRIKQAKELLRTTHLTATEIADKLGYQEPANFGRAFKRWCGNSPAAWRRQQN